MNRHRLILLLLILVALSGCVVQESLLDDDTDPVTTGLLDLLG